MQGKGLVISFAIALGLLSVYYLSFTWYARSIEAKADREVVYQMDSLEQKNPNLSVSEKESYASAFTREVLEKHSRDTLDLGIVKYTYEKAKDREIALGLDLKGGMTPYGVSINTARVTATSTSRPTTTGSAAAAAVHNREPDPVADLLDPDLMTRCGLTRPP